MSIKEMELFHGAVLAKLFRSDKPVSLRMVEMDFEQSRRAYLVNDMAYIYIKHGKNPRKSKRLPTFTWTFAFSNNHTADLLKLKGNRKEVYLALVCGQESVSSNDPAEICFLDWNQIWKCLDSEKLNEQQYIPVKYKKGYSFRVWGPKNTSNDTILVNQDSLADWDVPGV